MLWRARVYGDIPRSLSCLLFVGESGREDYVGFFLGRGGGGGCCHGIAQVIGLSCCVVVQRAVLMRRRHRGAGGSGGTGGGGDSRAAEPYLELLIYYLYITTCYLALVSYLDYSLHARSMSCLRMNRNPRGHEQKPAPPTHLVTYTRHSSC